MRIRRRPKSLREIYEANNLIDRFHAAMAGVAPRAQTELKPKRQRAAPDPNDSEAPVLKAVGELLAVHPQVLLAVRQNSGAMQYMSVAGRPVPIWFYKLIRTPGDMTIVDYWGFLRDGRPLALECKKPSWRFSEKEPREVKQRAFIRMIEAIGGIGGFVCSADEAQALLP